MKPAYEYIAYLTKREKLESVYDGDTVWLTVDLGFGMTWDIGPCRLLGIDAPEMRGADKVSGSLSRDFLREILSRPENQKFLIRTEKDKTEKYGRYLVTIILPDGTNVNKLLVESGHASVY